MNSSVLSKLPRELRDEIWRLSLQLSEDVYTFEEDGKPAIDAGVAEQHPLALSQTCKQIRAECHLIFYNLNQFCLDSTVLTRPYQSDTCKMANEPGSKLLKRGSMGEGPIAVLL